MLHKWYLFCKFYFKFWIKQQQSAFIYLFYFNFPQTKRKIDCPSFVFPKISFDKLMIHKINFILPNISSKFHWVLFLILKMFLYSLWARICYSMVLSINVWDHCEHLLQMFKNHIFWRAWLKMSCHSCLNIECFDFIIGIRQVIKDKYPNLFPCERFFFFNKHLLQIRTLLKGSISK